MTGHKREHRLRVTHEAGQVGRSTTARRLGVRMPRERLEERDAVRAYEGQEIARVPGERDRALEYVSHLQGQRQTHESNFFFFF